MKKLLSLLSVLTISGTAVPTTIAASPYQKEEQNLEILHRVKRGNQTKKNTPKNKTATDEDTNLPSTSTTAKNKKCGNRGSVNNQKCRKQNEDNSEITTKSAKERILDNIKSRSKNIFKSNRKNEYNEFLRESIQYFKETKNIVLETTNPTTGKKIYRIKKHNVEDSYKIIPLEVEDNKIDLILNKSNLYVDGIITYDDDENKTIVYFPDSNLDKNSKLIETEKDKRGFFSKILKFDIKDEKQEKTMIKKLYFDSNYNTLTSEEENIKINKENIHGAIINLSNINDDKISEIKSNKKAEAEIKKDFLRVIFTNAEATRFFSIRDEVQKVLSSSDSNPYEIDWQDHKNTLTNWDKNSQKYYEMKDSIELQLKMTLKEKNEIYNVAVLAVKDDEKIRDNQRG
ncbi:ribosome-inactivating family protein [Spiroplasma endosymbiont of Megaselia nigra]|uniref:ribosome-inactivating family protein n=1 Tax=Spiroplasma endosymbiont of Megaselia nigra TaxID=2478537 RepID=UPI000F889504|nr:ribosome-inactivating family protein [Spiroplasma endosymbiont of Megaselia nigra]RUO85959.1 hypothetical protein D9R21_05840 [Spiroplasma endosymbiont of Megaselia nigra]